MDDETRKYLIKTLTERQNLVYPGTKPANPTVRASRRVPPPAKATAAPEPEEDLPSWEEAMSRAIRLANTTPAASTLWLKIAAELRMMRMVENLEFEGVRQALLDDLLDEKGED